MIVRRLWLFGEAGLSRADVPLGFKWGCVSGCTFKRSCMSGCTACTARAPEEGHVSLGPGLRGDARGGRGGPVPVCLGF